MIDELVTVETFWNVTQAHLAKSALEAAGVDSFLENEHSALMTPHLASPAGIKLLVKKSDEQQAIEILNVQA